MFHNRSLKPFVLVLWLLLHSSVGARETLKPVLPEPFLIDVWQGEDGLPQVSVLALHQDRDGYLWIGTEEGLARFDGVRFEVFDRNTTPEIASSHIGALAGDGEGGLWIGTRSGLNHYREGRFRHFMPEGELAPEELRVLHADRSRQLWIGTHRGLSRFRDGTFKTFGAGDSLPSEAVWAIYEDRGGRLWVGTDGGLSRWQDGGFTHFDTGDGLHHNHVEAIFEDRSGRVWIGTQQGLNSFDDDRLVAHALPGGVSRPWIWTFHEDRHGVVWIGTDDGLKRFDERGFSSFERNDILPDPEIQSILEDHEGSLWIGTRHGGLARLRRVSVSSFGPPEGLVNPIAWAIYQGREGHVWIGTNDGLTRLGADGLATSYTRREGLPDTDVRSLYEDRDGRLWIGAYSQGLFIFEDGRFRSLTQEHGLPSIGVLGIEEDADGALWLATDGAGVIRYERSGSFRIYTVDDGLGSNVVKGLYKDRKGEIWFGTESGLSRFEDGAWTTLTRADGLPDVRVRTLHEDEEGNLWIGMREGGLSLLRDGEITSFTVDDGLYDFGLHRIEGDDAGRLWMTSNKGLFHVDRRELLAFADGKIDRFHSVTFDDNDGLRTNEFNGGFQPAGCRTRDGRLWFPTIAGVAIVDPERRVLNSVAPPVHIETILVDRRPLDLTAAVAATELSAGTREIEFHFTALSYLVPESVRFKHRLEGWDEDWVDAGLRRFVTYTNLDPKAYRFRVLASNNDGVWNETGATFEFRVRPAFYQTWWFLLVGTLALAGLGRVLYRLRIHHLVRRNRKLEQIRAELESKNAEIAAHSAELERFTYTVSHDLKSPLFTIQGFVGHLGRDLDQGHTERAREDLGRIRRAVHQMRQKLDELLELSRIGRVVNPLEEVELDELVGEALQLVAGRLTEGGIEVAVGAELPVVVADRRRLREVFQNLLDNAAKFIGDATQPRIEVKAEAVDGEVVCRVCDNGIGIPPAYHEKVFGLFEKLDLDDEGTGIGLAVVKRIVELHGGRIWVESEGEGRGSSFVFTLPRGGSLPPATEAGA